MHLNKIIYFTSTFSTKFFLLLLQIPRKKVIVNKKLSYYLKTLNLK